MIRTLPVLYMGFDGYVAWATRFDFRYESNIAKNRDNVDGKLMAMARVQR